MSTILAIESSCDEMSVAILRNEKELLANVVASQIDIHKQYGGVVPEIASRKHVECVSAVLREALRQANITPQDIDAIAVTKGPGLVGSLHVGMQEAKTLALALNVPLIGVHHIAGHIYANNLENTIHYPALALVVSGGHTELVYMRDEFQFEVIGTTFDDAIGEAYDKVGRVLHLPYPGGPGIEKKALEGKVTYDFPRPVMDNTYNFSYSGLKSRIINVVHNEKQRGNMIREADLAASFQYVAIDELVRKTDLALKNTGIKHVLVAGGVSANKFLRSEINKVAEKNGAKLSIPEFIYCTDNAAMIGAAAYPLYLKKEFADYSLNGESQADVC